MSNLLNKRNLSIFSLAVILFGAVFYFSYLNVSISKEIKDLSKQQEIRMHKELAKEKATINKDFAEKYHAETASFAAIFKQLEIERNKSKKLQEKEPVLKK